MQWRSSQWNSSRNWQCAPPTGATVRHYYERPPLVSWTRLGGWRRNPLKQDVEAEIVLPCIKQLTRDVASSSPSSPRRRGPIRRVVHDAGSDHDFGQRAFPRQQFQGLWVPACAGTTVECLMCNDPSWRSQRIRVLPTNSAVRS